MARLVRQAVVLKETVSQALEVLHNVGLLERIYFEKGIRIEAVT